MADYYQMLGVSITASASEIRAAYARLARERHPDRFTDPTEKAKAHAAFQELTTAFNTLFNASSRHEYDQQRERPKPTNPEDIARDAFERAGPAMEAGQADEVITLLRTAVHHAPNEARYRHALGKALGRSRATAREAVVELERAIQLQPREAAYHADLALVLHGQGLSLRAQKAVEAALRLAPRDPRIRKIASEVGLAGS